MVIDATGAKAVDRRPTSVFTVWPVERDLRDFGRDRRQRQFGVQCRHRRGRDLTVFESAQHFAQAERAGAGETVAEVVLHRADVQRGARGAAIP